ncbi:MAG: hypothetical protein I4O49_19865 [Janthinobacterium lividum]|nr:hypothetical protein [Janthinobacterium lividum]
MSTKRTKRTKSTGKPDGTAEMLIKLSGNAAPTSLRVDKITSSVPAYPFQRNGATV